MRFDHTVGRRIMYNKTYHELIQIPDYTERFEYLRLHGKLGETTFGWNRFVNQAFYQSRKWRSTRSKIIIRDNGCDMAFNERPIFGRIHIHHINPITLRMIEDEDPVLFDPNNLICVTEDTHRAIHYGDASLLIEDYRPRTPGDTKLW